MMLATLLSISLVACTALPPTGTPTGTPSGTSGSDKPNRPSEVQYDGIDHVITVPEGRDITVLQVTDTQAMLYEGIRKSFLDENGDPYESDNRFNQVHNTFFASGITDTYIRTWQYVEEGVRRTNPDIIVLTGDNIYGETDDEGKLWLEMIEVLDSFKIPWLCIFGNHDNESQKGVNWQVEAVQNSQYGYMKDGDLKNGNSNYTVGICQGGQLKYVFYMLDTNGCSTKPHNFGESLLPYNPDIADIEQKAGIFFSQRYWISECARKIAAYGENIPSLMFMHIPPIEAAYSVTDRYTDPYATWPFYPEREYDFGMATEPLGGFESGGQFWAVAKEANCVGMFMGHQHNVATSTEYDGIRLTYGLKTGTADYHDPNILGTTKITISEADNTFSVEYIMSEIPYPLG